MVSVSIFTREENLDKSHIKSIVFCEKAVSYPSQ